MSTVANIGKLLVVLSLIFFWTFVASLRMLFEILKYRGDFFRCNSRPKKPKILTEGWNHHFIQLSDVKIHYVSCGDPSKPLMLMIHGFPEFWYSWRHQMKEFAEQFHVVAIDMRGYGDSDKPKGISKYTYDLLVKDIKEIIPALGYNSCVLVAHDWGGAITWKFAGQEPDFVQKLIVLNAPNGEAMGAYLQENPKQLLKSWYMFFFQTPLLPEMMIRSRDLHAFEEMQKTMSAGTKEDLEALKYTYAQPGAITAPINYYRANLMSRLLNPPAKMTIVQPKTLIIWGTNDIALETGLAKLSAKYCRDVTIELVEGASHFVHEDKPAIVTELMKKWLKL